MEFVRHASRVAALALGVWAASANAQLPSHPLVQVLRPNAADTTNSVQYPFADFGTSVAVYKSMALVGMPNTWQGTLSDVGRVGVFTRRDGVWQRTGTFSSPASKRWNFGRHVALEDDGAMIGDQFTMYVMKYTQATGWKIVQWVKPPKHDTPTNFPIAVQFKCNTVIATANSYDQTVYFYDRLADGTLALRSQFKAPAGPEQQNFGASLAVDCNLAVVGAPNSIMPGVSIPGSAYVFRRENGTWRYVQHLVPPDGATGDQFGASVAINQQKIFVGAPEASTQVNQGARTAEQGVVYIYSPANGVYGVTDRLHPTAEQHNHYAHFGEQVSVTDRQLFVRASTYNFDESYDRMENLVFSYSRSGGTAQAVGIARGVPEALDIAASGNRLFVGAPEDVECTACTGTVNIYDVEHTQ